MFVQCTTMPPSSLSIKMICIDLASSCLTFSQTRTMHISRIVCLSISCLYLSVLQTSIVLMSVSDTDTQLSPWAQATQRIGGSQPSPETSSLNRIRKKPLKQTNMTDSFGTVFGSRSLYRFDKWQSIGAAPCTN